MKNEFTYPSGDGRTSIHAIEWIPDTEVTAVLQIAHGMVEFIGRYDRFGTLLAEKGIYVVGNDHLGHGSSVVSQGDHGYFAEKDGNLCVIGDMHALREMTQKKYPGVPYFLLGHSMGSFLARQYIEMYGEGLAGAIIMGTGVLPEGALKAALALSRVTAKMKGWRYRSRLIDSMALGSYNKKFEPARTKNDWLTKDEAIVDAYNANPWNNFRFTVNGYYNMFTGIAYAQKEENIRRIPKDLPVLIVSGEEDPVGEFGKGPQKLFEIYRKAGLTDVTIKLYPGDRHEILNETDHELVDKDILDWIEEKRPQEAAPQETAQEE